MIDLPKSTIFGKRIPKQKFYDNLTVPAHLKRVFAEQINLITWRNKIAPTTLNIAEGESVKEIEIISIRLNQRELDKRVLPLIDKEIPYHILFLLEYNKETQAWISYKEHVCAVSSRQSVSAFKPGIYYHTDWLKPEALNLRIDGLNMDKVYENLIRQVAGERLGDKDDDIKESVKRDEQRRKLTKEIAALEKKAMKEQHPRRKWELAEEVNKLKAQMEVHTE